MGDQGRIKDEGGRMKQDGKLFHPSLAAERLLFEPEAFVLVETLAEVVEGFELRGE
jgi:hypothetical protein